jgi:SAM-dependent methyltransferase
MQPAPALFDTDLLAARRARAGRGAGADFLHEAMAAEVSERLKEVNRTFTAPAVVGPRAALWADRLAEAGLAPPHRAPDAEPLGLAEGAHDLLVHALALHWANDPVGQLVQARRALRPDGLFLGLLFGGQTLAELRAALATAEIELTGGLSPRVAPMGEIRDLGGLLQRAGFAMPVADSHRLTVTYATAFDLMRDLRAMGETNVLRDRLRRPTRRAVFLRAAALYAERFAGPDARIPATFEIVVLTGWAPAADQPRPLRPGSARCASPMPSASPNAGGREGRPADPALTPAAGGLAESRSGKQLSC